MADVVNVHAGANAVRAYIKAHADLGVEHVKALIAGERDALLALTADVTSADAELRPAADEFSISQVVQHLNASFERSHARLRALSAGRAFSWTGPPARAGGLPEKPAASLADALDRFVAGANEVLRILGEARPGAKLDLVAEHAAFGPMNWLEWATYSHHVHTHDHVEQIAALKNAIRLQRDQPTA